MRKTASIRRKARTGFLFLLALMLAAAYMPAAAMAADGSETIHCDISKGSVKIGQSSRTPKITYTDSQGQLHDAEDFDADAEIEITGTTTENTIYTSSYWANRLNITLKDVNIDVSAVSDGASGKKSMCAAYFGGVPSDDGSISPGGVNLTLEGKNVLKSLDYAGIAVPVGETLRIDGDGSLDVSTVTGNASTAGPAIGMPVSNNTPPAFIGTAQSDTGFGKIIIDGGTIYAHGDDAGIGGGQHCTCGDIVINDGSITAKAGDSSASGIGCGQDSCMGSILIRGGSIDATGSNSGAGIGGGGMHTDSGIITILGGDITATGGNYGAGIGGDGTNGVQGNAEQIHIGGGTIKAYGGKSAAGIGGGGPYGLAEDIVITGGTVEAYGGDGFKTEGNAYQMPIGVVGTRTSVYAAGAGIGNGGAVFSHTTYTTGPNAGTEKTDGSTKFGGRITITGGTVKAYNGILSSEDQAAVKALGMTYADAEAIGNGGYASDKAFLDENPYKETDTVINGGVIYLNSKIATKPGSTSVTAASKKKGQITVAWKKASHASKYQIAYRRSGKKSWKYKITAARRVTIRKLSKGKKYTVKVRAHNAAGYGQWSKTKTVKVKAK